MNDDLILLLSSFLSVLSIVVDKRASEKADAWSCTAAGILFQFLIALPVVWILRDEPLPEGEVFAWLIAGGGLTASARFFWFYALRGDLLTRLAPFRRFSTVFTLLIATLILGEKNELERHELVGAVVMISGGLLVSWDRMSLSFSRMLHGNRYVLCVLYFALAIAVMKAIDKHVLDVYGVSVWMVYFLSKAGQALFVLPSAFVGRVRFSRISDFRPLMLSHVLQMIASMLFLSVLTRQTLTLSEPISAVAPLMVLVMSRYWLGEKDVRFAWRFWGAGVMVLGYYVMKGAIDR